MLPYLVAYYILKESAMNINKNICGLILDTVVFCDKYFFLFMVLFTNPSARAGYDTRSIFKRSLTGFEFRVFLLLD